MGYALLHARRKIVLASGCGGHRPKKKYACMILHAAMINVVFLSSGFWSSKKQGCFFGPLFRCAAGWRVFRRR